MSIKVEDVSRAVRRVLLAVNRSQKTDFEIQLGDTDITIFMTHGGFDKKITGGVLAEVMKDDEEYKQGELVLCHHNTFDRDLENGLGINFADATGLKTDDGRMVFAIKSGMIFLKVNPLTGDAIATRKYMVAEMVQKPEVASTLIMTPDAYKAQYYKDRFRVIDAHEDSMFRKGDVVFTDQYGGLPVHYVFNKKERVVIRIAEEDVLAMEERES